MMCKFPDEARSAFDAACRALDQRPYSRAELMQKLNRKGFHQAECEAALQRLEELKLVDDSALAPLLADFMVRKGWGSRKALYRMKQKGIAGDLAVEAVGEAYSESDEEAMAIEAAAKKDRSLGDKDRLKKKASVARHLAQKGFSAGVIRRALEALYG